MQTEFDIRTEKLMIREIALAEGMEKGMERLRLAAALTKGTSAIFQSPICGAAETRRRGEGLS